MKTPEFFLANTIFWSLIYFFRIGGIEKFLKWFRLWFRLTNCARSLRRYCVFCGYGFCHATIEGNHNRFKTKFPVDVGLYKYFAAIYDDSYRSPDGICAKQDNDRIVAVFNLSNQSMTVKVNTKEIQGEYQTIFPLQQKLTLNSNSTVFSLQEWECRILTLYADRNCINILHGMIFEIFFFSVGIPPYPPYTPHALLLCFFGRISFVYTVRPLENAIPLPTRR